MSIGFNPWEGEWADEGHNRKWSFRLLQGEALKDYLAKARMALDLVEVDRCIERAEASRQQALEAIEKAKA